MVIELAGKVHSSNDSVEFRGHHVLVSYVTQKGNEKNGESCELSSEILPNGTFSLVLPDDLVEGILAEVISTDRKVLESPKFSKDQLKDDKIVIDCHPKSYFSIPANEDPRIDKKISITGIIIDEDGLQKISNKQEILYGFPINSSDKEGLDTNRSMY